MSFVAEDIGEAGRGVALKLRGDAVERPSLRRHVDRHLDRRGEHGDEEGEVHYSLDSLQTRLAGF